MKWRQRNWNSGGVKWVRWAVSSTVFFFVCLFVFFLTINENALLHTSTPILELVEAKNLFFSRFWIKFTVSYQNLTKHHNTIFLKIETYPHNMYISLWPNVYIPHHPQYIIYPKKKLRYFHDSTQKSKKTHCDHSRWIQPNLSRQNWFYLRTRKLLSFNQSIQEPVPLYRCRLLSRPSLPSLSPRHTPSAPLESAPSPVSAPAPRRSHHASASLAKPPQSPPTCCLLLRSRGSLDDSLSSHDSARFYSTGLG